MFDEEMKNKEIKNFIMKILKRKDRVEMILNLLLFVQRNDVYDVFIKILWEKENIDIVSLNKLLIKMYEEVGIYLFIFYMYRKDKLFWKKKICCIYLIFIEYVYG